MPTCDHLDFCAHCQASAGTERLRKRIAELELEAERNTVLVRELAAAVREIKDLRVRVAELGAATLAFREMNTCYRLGKRPSEKLLARLGAANAALKGGE